MIPIRLFSPAGRASSCASERLESGVVIGSGENGGPERSRYVHGTDAPRVLVALQTGTAWSRGVLRGFAAAAHERGWTLLHYDPSTDLDWLAHHWAPAAALIGPELPRDALSALASTPLVSVTVDRSADGIASVCVDEGAVADLALQHLLATGLRRVSTFCLDESPLAVARGQAFIERARAARVEVAAGWAGDRAARQRGVEDAPAISAWLGGLPRPCGVFAIADRWARTVSRYARLAGLRMPEDLALIGADNDVLECELMAPALSSVMIPWQELGKSASDLVQLALSGQQIDGRRIILDPVGVVARRSSDALAIEDPLVATAVRWIRSNAARRLTVPMVAGAVGGGRQRLERRFRRVLDRTVQDEIRRAHIDKAKELLAATQAGLPEVAAHSGFTNASMLSVAFQRELGMPPGAYRRRVHAELAAANGD